MHRIFISTLLVASAMGTSADAAVIAWGSPTTIAGAGDVSTAGVTYAAANFGGTGNPAVTVNGVTFNPINITNPNTSSVSSGPITLTETETALFGNNGTGASNTGAFAAMPDANYKALLSSEINSIVIFSLQLTTSGLTIGQSYQVQLWCNYSSSANTNKVAITGGPTLDDNTTDVVGGLGQYVIGTFVADSASQMIEMKGVPGTVLEDTEFGPITLPLINAYRIAAVPEPAALCLFVLGAPMLVRRRRQG